MLNPALSKSFEPLFELEITTTLGCPVACSYCPQAQLSSSKGKRKPSLSFDDFVKAINNVDLKLGLAWTGYSEPCLSPHLGEMLNFAHQKGFKQVISTTLAGNSKSVFDAIKFPHYSLFTLHLPDKDGLMTGIVVDDEYLERLDFALDYQINHLSNTENFRVITFGDDFHPDISKKLSPFLDSGRLTGRNVKLRGEVSSRSQGLSADELSVVTLLSSNSSRPNVTPETSYYCNKRKLNQPVLLPDGDLNICSFDYGLRSTYGNLFENKLSDIFFKYLSRIENDYLSGNLLPCTKCEHYVPIKTK